MGDLDEDALYVATADGELVALKARTGAQIWRQKALLHRAVGTAIMDNAVVPRTSRLCALA